MNLELFIAKKIHFSKEGDREVTPPAVRIAMIGIALGLAVMILSVAIVIGFKKEVRNKVIGFGSHIQIMAKEVGLQVSVDLIYGSPGESLQQWERRDRKSVV